MTDILLPNGFEKAAPLPQGKATIYGLTPERTALRGLGPEGATTKKGTWRDYYDMYRQHAYVRAAIDKIAKTATNTGFDFVAKDTLTSPKSREVKTIKDFFNSQPDFIYELRRVYKDLMIYGDAFIYIVPDRTRRPSHLKRLHPKSIAIKANKHGKVEAYYQWNPDALSQDDIVTFNPEEIIHFRIDDPDNDLYGLSPLESLKWAVTSDIYAQIYNGAFFKNSGLSGTIIAIKNSDPAEIERNRKWLTENYSGLGAAHKPIVIEGSNVTVEKAVVTHNEMGFLEGRTFIIQEILAVLDVPPAKLGIMESANRSNSKEQDKTFRGESIAPLQYIVESALNEQLLQRIFSIETVIFRHSESDTRDQIEQMDYFTKGEAWGVFSPNEIRERLGMIPVDGGDTHFIMTPTGAVPIDRMDLYFQLPQTNTDAGVPPTEDDPVEGEPMPKPPKKESENLIRPATTKSFNPTLAVQGAIIKVAEAKKLLDDSTLRKAYSYAMDAAEGGEPLLALAADTLRKACSANDPLLKRGYLERAEEIYGQMLYTEKQEDEVILDDKSLEMDDE
jgi:HK97 family phage portal protein